MKAKIPWWFLAPETISGPVYSLFPAGVREGCSIVTRVSWVSSVRQDQGCACARRSANRGRAPPPEHQRLASPARASAQPDQRRGVSRDAHAQLAALGPQPLAGPWMKLSIAPHCGSLERDPGLAVDRRTLKALDSSPLESTGCLGKGNLDVAYILVEDGYQTPPAIPTRRIGRKVRALCLKRCPMQGALRKLLRQHQSVVLRSHHKAASDRTHDRRIITVRAPMQVDSHAAHGRHLQAEVSRPQRGCKRIADPRFSCVEARISLGHAKRQASGLGRVQRLPAGAIERSAWMQKQVDIHPWIGRRTLGVVVARYQHDLFRNVLRKLLHPLLVGGRIRSGHRNLRELLMKRSTERLPPGQELVAGPGLVPLMAMLKEIGLVAELHAHQLAPERLGHKAALGERLLRRASAKVQAIDAAPAGG